MAGDWVGVMNGVLTKYIRKETPGVINNRKILKKLMEAGKITFNHSGKDVDWPVEYRRDSIRVYADMQPLEFARYNQIQRATLPWGSYVLTRAVSEMDKLKNRNQESLSKLFTDPVKSMMRAAKESFGDELWKDGNATGNEGRIHGFQSFTGGSVAGNGTTANAGVIIPSDTYAGLSTALGDLGGTWTGAWPNTGTANDDSYDYWSPLLVDWSANSVWGGSDATFKNNGRAALKFAIAYLQRHIREGQTYFTMDYDHYRLLSSAIEANERVLVSRKESDTGTLAVGTPSTFTLDGAEIAPEYGVPSEHIYGVNLNYMELMCLTPELFTLKGPEYDINQHAYKYLMFFYGNLKFETPRHTVLMKNY